MNKALICVDVQPDFLPGGPLGVPDGDKVIVELIRLMGDVDVIFLTGDWHVEDHISFDDDPLFADGSWPRHCVMGTEGAKIDDRLREAAIATGKPVILIHKGFERDLEAYSGFDGVVADVWNVDGSLRDTLLWNWDDPEDRPVTMREALVILGITENNVGGLALDYCVLATAEDSAEYGFRTIVHLLATRPVAFVTGAQALVKLVRAGVKLKGE